MRLNPSAAAVTTVASRTETPTQSSAELKSTAGLKTTAAPGQLAVRDEFRGIGPGGCLPGPRPLPFPLPGPQPLPFPPFPRPGDATGRAQGNQLHQIAEGVRNGSITSQEAERLLQQQENIAKATEQAMADGRLSTEERLRLNLMQARAGLNIHQASHNGQRDFFARFDSAAQRQADQIDRIANGRQNGNITAHEATELLDQQGNIADARDGSWGALGDLLVDYLQDRAGRDISVDSLPGDQTKWDPFPLPPFFPSPPFPMPVVRRPELDVHMLRNSVIAG